MRESRGELLNARFWAKVRIAEGCWEWTGGGHTYGQIKIEGRMRLAHHVSYELAHGPIPPGVQVLHHCDNPGCVRPDHLFLGTQSDNLRDMVAKGRGLTDEQQSAIRHPHGDDHWMRSKPERIARGERHGRAKMTAETVQEARRLSADGWTLARLAERYGVRMSTLSMIIRRVTWRHLP